MVEQASHFRKAVDDLISFEKSLSGEPSWQRSAYEGCYRWLSPLAVGGRLTGMNICVDSYPRSPFLNFHILIIYEVTVARLDFSEIDRHHNHTVKRVRTPSGIEIGWIHGPHVHRWQDNRGLFMPGVRPKELEFAVKLPDNIRTFDSVFRHFCSDVNVTVAANQMPALPLRDTLL